MKIIQKHIYIIAAIISLISLNSCEDHLELKIPYPNDITFNDLELDRFTYNIPDAPYLVGDESSGIITVNVSNEGGGNYSGFALSNKNWRSYPWNLSPDFAPAGGITAAEMQASIDSCAFSVYTSFLANTTENYLVGHADANDAYFTLSTPATVEHVLIANTTYNYLMATFGSIYSGTYDSSTQSYLIDGTTVSNHLIPNTDLKGRFSLPAPGGDNAVRLSGHEVLARRQAGEEASLAVLNSGGTTDEADDAYDAAYDAMNTGYIKLDIEGSLNGSITGNVEFYLASRENVVPGEPEYEFVLRSWTSVDLTSLGEVDKVLFKISSSYVDDTGAMIYSPSFCLDGIRLNK